MKIIRSALETYTRNWILRRRLPAAFDGVPIYVSPSAGLRYLFRRMSDIDPVLLNLAKEFVKKDAVVWDVGANVGLFTAAAASLAGAHGSVVAIEPDVWLVQVLQRTAKAQSRRVAPITVVPGAVASEVAVRSFVLATRSRSANFLEGYGTTQAGGGRETMTTLSVSLDWLLGFFPAPAVLKIDVEGAELEVLAGSHRLFDTARPVVIVEVAAAAASEVTTFFHNRGYALYDAEERAIPRSPVSRAPWMTLALPA